MELIERMKNKVIATVEKGSNRKLVESLLAANTSNRQPKRSHIEYLLAEIEKGRWSITNQGVGLSESGVLIDGQHRLLAIKEAGFPPVPFILVTNLPEDAAKYVDIGVKRSSRDLLKLLFDVNAASRVSAALQVLLKYKSGKWNAKFSPDDLINEYEFSADCVAQVLAVENASKLSAPVLAAFAFKLRESGDGLVLGFCDQVIKGEMLKTGDPALTLRNWLASSHGMKGGGEVQRIRFLKSLNAIQAFLEGRTLVKLYSKEV